MPLSRMENTTFAMPSIIDSHDMGLRTVYSPDAQKKTPIQTPKCPSARRFRMVREDTGAPSEGATCVFTTTGLSRAS
ncbi:hypothetical protein TNCV_858561 [Trichonephila clavipes]|nr:hypothetical protein TNCV_858561 [Trichonephila clavipes]